MRRARLDKIDLKILADLQADGRMTNVDLAKRAGISAPPCLRRVRALEEEGAKVAGRDLPSSLKVGLDDLLEE